MSWTETMTSLHLFQYIRILRRLRVAIFADIIKILKQSLRTKKS